MSGTQIKYKKHLDTEAGGLNTEVYIFKLAEKEEYEKAIEAFRHGGFRPVELFVNNALAFQIELHRITI